MHNLTPETEVYTHGASRQPELLVETVLIEEKEMSLPQTTPTYTGRYHDSHLTINFESETAQLDSAPMKLTAKTFTLLAFLARHASQLVPRETLLLLVWGYREGVRTRTLDVHIRQLRKSLGKYGNAYIETICGVGYRFSLSRAGSFASRLRRDD
jgi:DNA-binding response OmpR family regulator